MTKHELRQTKKAAKKLAKKAKGEEQDYYHAILQRLHFLSL